MRRTYRYRLYPTRAQTEALDAQLADARGTYWREQPARMGPSGANDGEKKPVPSEKPSALADGVITQRSRALQRANEIRSRRAAERRHLRGLGAAQARERLHHLMMECPDWLAGVPVHVLLRWIPGVGEANATRLLSLIDVRGVRYAGQLTVRQRELLAIRLEHRKTKTGVQR